MNSSQFKRPNRNISRKSRILIGTAVFLAVCAFGAAGVVPLAPDAAALPVKAVTEELVLPQLSEQIAALQERDQNYVQEEKIRPGDTLATLLTRLGVDDQAAAGFIKSDSVARGVLQLKAGRRVQVQIGEDGELQWLSTTVADSRDNPVRNVVIKRDGDTFKAFESAARLERRIEMRTANIKSSLFAATDSALIPDSIARQIVDMFATDIDFASDLRRGDHFDVVYETLWQDGDLVRSGRVLAAEFVNAGKVYQAVWFGDSSGKQGGFYGLDGKSLKKAFLKSPIEFSRISSGFAMRTHPISGKWKQHKGVDFAAASGTPIRASGDGTVEFLGAKGGYGNVVVLKHWADFSTAYAHMSRFAAGVRKGTKVSQGDIIGYVGSTGWASGPHLHYEFRVHDQARDPMSVVVPNTPPLAGAELERFRGLASEMSHRFALLNLESKSVKLASK